MGTQKLLLSTSGSNAFSNSSASLFDRAKSALSHVQQLERIFSKSLDCITANDLVSDVASGIRMFGLRDPKQPFTAHEELWFLEMSIKTLILRQMLDLGSINKNTPPNFALSTKSGALDEPVPTDDVER